MKKIAVYPGSFDPFTKGHEDIVNKALKIFDEVIIGIGVNTSKSSFFSDDSKSKHISSIYSSEDKVKVTLFSGLTTKFCKEQNAQFIVRGLRSNKDFDYELPISQTNKVLDSTIDTIYLTSEIELNYIQSSIVREIYKSGGKIDSFVTNSEILVKK